MSIQDRLPQIRNHLIEQYGGLSESAASSVAEGLKNAELKTHGKGIAATNADVFEILSAGFIHKGSGKLPIQKMTISSAGDYPALHHAKDLQQTRVKDLSSFYESVFGKATLEVAENPSLQDMKGVVKNAIQLEQQMLQVNRNFRA